MKVGIIGGGVGGLGAGYQLSKLGHQVAIYERAPFIGGLASTFDVGGGRLERFYHHLFTSDHTIIDLLDELGLGDRLIWQETKTGFFHDGKSYPFSTPMDLLRFTPVSLIDRIRMGLVTVYLQRVKNWRKFEGTTAAAFMRKWMGKRNYEVVWEPMLQGKFAGYYEQIGMPWMWSKFATRVASRGKTFKEQLGYIGGSWGVLIDEMERRIKEAGGEVYTGASVGRVMTREGRVTGLEVEGADGAVSQREFDAVIATIPGFLLPRLVELPDEYVARLQGVDYEGAIAVIWVLKHSLSPIYWLTVADKEMPFLLALEQTNLVPPSEYGGKHIVYTADYVDKDDRRWNMGSEEIIKEYLEGLKRINPDFDESWVEAYYLHKEPAAQPIITTNYSQRIPSTRTPIKGLYLAAMSQVYPQDRGTNYSIQLGMQVAHQAAEEAENPEG